MSLFEQFPFGLTALHGIIFTPMRLAETGLDLLEAVRKYGSVELCVPLFGHFGHCR